MKPQNLYKMMNETIGGEVTVESFLPKHLDHGTVHTYDKTELRNFEKKRVSMFDKLIRILVNSKDKDLNEYAKRAGGAKIFNFDAPRGIYCEEDTAEHADGMIMKAAVDVVPEDISHLTSEQFLIPFPNTALVFPDAILILGAVAGKPTFYTFISLTTVKLAPKLFIDILQMGIVGWSEKELKEGKLKTHSMQCYIVRSNEKAYRDEKFEPGLRSWLVQVPFIYLAKINTLDRFILEVSPIKTDIRSPKYIPRSHQRPEYILLHPGEIRRYMKTESDIEGHKMRGHERRAHLRKYPDDKIRFPNAHGKVIQIDAVWIGRTEATVGERHYKVIL